jgi:hypothetical protein
MTKRNSTEGQTTIYKHTPKTKDRVTRTPLKTGVNPGLLCFTPNVKAKGMTWGWFMVLNAIFNNISVIP